MSGYKVSYLYASEGDKLTVKTFESYETAERFCGQLKPRCQARIFKDMTNEKPIQFRLTSRSLPATSESLLIWYATGQFMIATYNPVTDAWFDLATRIDPPFRWIYLHELYPMMRANP